MNSNKSRAGLKRIALEPQRRHGKRRVADLMEAGAAVIAEKGFPLATMAEIAVRAGAPIGSLYRFFPNKEILADALIERFCGLVDEAFRRIDRRVSTLSAAELAEALLALMEELEGEKSAVRALLEAQADSSARRMEFRRGVLRRIARTLALKGPHLGAKMAKAMAVVVLFNMKAAGAMNEQLTGEALSGARAELKEMTRLYLAARLKTKKGHRAMR